MSNNLHIAKAYLLLNCPFSFKFLLFMTETGLLEQIEVIIFDVNESDYESKKLKLGELLGTEVSFPSVEIEPGVYESDSDTLIEYYSEKSDINNEDLKTLEYYKNGIFKGIIRLFIENKELKSKAVGA